MLRKVLYIDLSSRESWIEERLDLFEDWMGGTGVGIKLLQEECPAGTDPLSPQAPIILSIGPLNGFFPVATKTVRPSSRRSQESWASPMQGEGFPWP